MSTQPEQPKKRKSGVTGVAIPAGLLIGIGVGLLTDNVAAGVMIGLGCGFLGLIILRVILGDW